MRNDISIMRHRYQPKSPNRHDLHQPLKNPYELAIPTQMCRAASNQSLNTQCCHASTSTKNDSR